MQDRLRVVAYHLFDIYSEDLGRQDRDAEWVLRVAGRRVQRRAAWEQRFRCQFVYTLQNPTAVSRQIQCLET